LFACWAKLDKAVSAASIARHGYARVGILRGLSAARNNP